MSTLEALRRIETDPDFINVKRFDFSLENLLERYPDGASTKLIAQALMLTEDQVNDLYEEIIVKIRTGLQIED